VFTHKLESTHCWWFKLYCQTWCGLKCYRQSDTLSFIHSFIFIYQ